jgi:hypothetical protein
MPSKERLSEPLEAKNADLSSATQPKAMFLETDKTDRNFKRTLAFVIL